MFLNCGVGEDSWEWTARTSNQSILKEIILEYWLEGLMLKLKFQYFDHLMWRTDSFEKIWKRLKTGGEGDDRAWDGWMASLTWWTWVWAISVSWWWTGKPGVLQIMGSQRVRYSWATELNWTNNMNWSEVAQLCPTLCDPMDLVYQTPPSMGFSRQ